MNYDVNMILEAIREYQEKITDDGRLMLWEQVMEGYCQTCGRDESGGKCFCDPSYDV